MASSTIFGLLDKRERAASAAAAADETSFGFEDRADLLMDLLEEDTTSFPLLSCPPEVLAGFLLFLEGAAAVRLRPLCGGMRGSIDGNTGLWCSLTARDFQDLGGVTKHYRGLGTLADWDNSKAFVRLEWDPLMICAPPSLRYALLAAGRNRRRKWDECGHALGAGWVWFSAKVCRRMATSTFLRWASLQHDVASVKRMLGQFAATKTEQAKLEADKVTPEMLVSGTAAEEDPAQPGVKFRCNRSDAVTLSFEAATDIYDTVQRWHTAEHKAMMRAHIKGSVIGAKGPDSPGCEDAMSPQTASAAFSVTPTLDAAEAAMSVADSLAPESQASTGTESSAPPAGSPELRGAASHHIEEAQLRLALELSKAEAEASEAGAESKTKPECCTNGCTRDPWNGQRGESCCRTCSAFRGRKHDADCNRKMGPKLPPEKAKQEELSGLLLRAEGSAPAMMVYLKEHCLARRVDALPERFEASIESIVNKMVKSSTWVLLYESTTEELTFRAKLAAEALCASNVCAIDELLSTDISVSQERECLPVWKSSASLMSSLSRLRASSCDAKLRQARCNLIRQASLEWCEHEDLTKFLDEQLQPLGLEIDNFRGMNEVQGHAHTPHVADIGMLMFRNFCLLDCRVFRPLCLAAYALVHELHAAKEGDAKNKLLELLEGLHAMLLACDVADDHLSCSKDTKETFEELLLKPITLAMEHYASWDTSGNPVDIRGAGDGQRRKPLYR